MVTVVYGYEEGNVNDAFNDAFGVDQLMNVVNGWLIDDDTVNDERWCWSQKCWLISISIAMAIAMLNSNDNSVDGYVDRSPQQCWW